MDDPDYDDDMRALRWQLVRRLSWKVTLLAALIAVGAWGWQR